jgi:hypothetical protein
MIWVGIVDPDTPTASLSGPGRPFLEAGRRVFIAKPIIGRPSDVTALRDLEARTAAPVMAGSTRLRVRARLRGRWRPRGRRRLGRGAGGRPKQPVGVSSV